MSDKSGLYTVLAVSLVAVLGLAFAFIGPSDVNIVGDAVNTLDGKYTLDGQYTLESKDEPTKTDGEGATSAPDTTMEVEVAGTGGDATTTSGSGDGEVVVPLEYVVAEGEAATIEEPTATCVQCMSREPVLVLPDSIRRHYGSLPTVKSAATICSEMGHAGCLLAYQGVVHRIFEDEGHCGNLDSSDDQTHILPCGAVLPGRDTSCATLGVGGMGYSRAQSTSRYIKGIVCLG